MEINSRHHLRSDGVTEIEDALADGLGVNIEGETYERVAFEDDDLEVVLIDGKAAVAYFDGEPFLTVRGANEYPPERRVVTVDAGAISFVSNGADVMRPGIVKADPEIEDGDLVVIAEETHGKALAVGRAQTHGGDMAGESGKVVDSLHHVGDDLYGVSL